LGAEIFTRIKTLGCNAVHIGGGEPLLHPDKLGNLLDLAGNIGVKLAYVETNSAWFVGPKEARSTLTSLKRRGLSTLLVSISPFHHRFIPFRRVRGVMDACRETGVAVFPWVAEFIPDLAAFEPDATPSPESYTERFGDAYFVEVLRRYWVHMGGRALETYAEVLPKKSPAQILDANRGSCTRELSDTSHFHIDLFGSYIPGLCSGIGIAMEDLHAPLGAKKYPLVECLVSRGIRGLYDYAVQDWGYLPAHRGYINKCDLCTEIRAYLFFKGNQGRPWAELNPAGFYEELHRGGEQSHDRASPQVSGHWGRTSRNPCRNP
jgi:hypothetical protein